MADGTVSSVASSSCVFGAALIGRLMGMSMGATGGYDDGLPSQCMPTEPPAW